METQNNGNTVLCGANSYTQKYYLNPDFRLLPEEIRQELQIMCVSFTEDVGGQMTVEFTPEGRLVIITAAEDADYLYDEIESGLRISSLQRQKEELFEQLEMFYNALSALRENRKDQ